MNQSLHALLLHDLQSLYDVEHQLADILPTLSEEASFEGLKEAFMHHARQTEQQIQRLEDAFASLKETPDRISCNAMQTLLEEAMDTLEQVGEDEQARDAALVGAAQIAEHFETGAYEAAWMLAQAMDHDEVAGILRENCEEEEATSKTLAKLGKKIVGMTISQRARGMVQ